jgi:hypothetical protein
MLEKFQGKSHGGICGEFIRLYDARALKTALVANGKYIAPLNNQYNDEQFFFIKDTGSFSERPIQVNGTEMYESTLTMIIAGDDESRIRELERIRRKKWVLRFTDRSHTDKLIGHPSGAYASLMYDERRGGLIRSDRREISVTWRCITPEPIAVYRL